MGWFGAGYSLLRISEHNTENLNFHLAVMTLRRSAAPAADLYPMACEIYDEFLKPSGTVFPAWYTGVVASPI